MSVYRQIILNLLGGKCDTCGSIERLEIHHRDGNRENNDVLNIQLLCYSCHRYGKPGINKNMVRIGNMGNSLRMTIPKSIACALNLKAGDHVEANIADGNMIVKREANPSE